MRLLSEVVLFLLFSSCLTDLTIKSSGTENDTAPQDHDFFLQQIFDKYGHKGIISFEVSSFVLNHSYLYCIYLFY
ncbi:hypothetical protein L9F63_000870 [Diploptera punctata]|uniref:Uncharacterized protein n=1 Tax=Diploptera punctata TaxID=6984 RepID=A0AAD8ALM0_DIPPU|nr:hypothetical protein L9F63_000870 [Diploptera punctata]